MIADSPDSNLAQRLGIQPRKGQKPSIQWELGSEDIAGISLRKFTLAQGDGLYRSNGKQDVHTERLPERSQRHRFWNINHSHQ